MVAIPNPTPQKLHILQKIWNKFGTSPLIKPLRTTQPCKQFCCELEVKVELVSSGIIGKKKNNQSVLENLSISQFTPLLDCGNPLASAKLKLWACRLVLIISMGLILQAVLHTPVGNIFSFQHAINTTGLEFLQKTWENKSSTALLCCSAHLSCFCIVLSPYLENEWFIS